MSDDKPLSSHCYHKRHEQCAGPGHCGCDCHNLLNPAEEGGDAVPEPEMVSMGAFLEIVGQRDYYKKRLLEEIDRNHSRTTIVETLQAENEGLKKRNGGS